MKNVCPDTGLKLYFQPFIFTLLKVAMNGQIREHLIINYLSYI